MANFTMGSKMQPLFVTPLGLTVTTANVNDVGIYITYIGTSASATVEVASGGDMTLKHGVLAAEAVDTGVGVSGVFDLSTPGTYTTMGKLCDSINISSNWRARLGASLRADLTDNKLIDGAFIVDGALVSAATAQAKGIEVGVCLDSTVIKTATLFMSGTAVGRGTLLGPPDAGVRNWITRIEGLGTSAGVHNLNVYSCNPLTKTQNIVFTAPLTSATVYEFNDMDFGAQGGICSKPGEYLVVRHEATSAAITAFRMQVIAHCEYLGGPTAGRMAPISGM